MNTLSYIIPIVILIFSAVIHEYMHGWMANRLGDPTARHSGRLTLNPLAHLDLFGSIILPLLLVVTGSPFVFGYAKPVPYNPLNLRDKKWGPPKVALAGPFSNLVLAVVFGLMLRFITGVESPTDTQSTLGMILAYIVIINLVLMVFNLVPIPPLDGSKIIIPFLPEHLKESYMRLEPFGFPLVILFLILGLDLVWNAVVFLFVLIVGG